MKLALILVLCFSLVVVIRGKFKPVYDEYIDDDDTMSSSTLSGSRQIVKDGGEMVTADWVSCVTCVNGGVITFRNFIGKIEEVLAKLVRSSISVVTFIPVTIARIALALAGKVVSVLLQAKLALEGFFRSIFGLQAKALHGTVMEMDEVVQRILNWARVCVKSQGANCTQLPHVGGFGPCGGAWPCKTTIVCHKPICVLAVTESGLQELTPGQLVSLRGRNDTSGILEAQKGRNDTSGQSEPLKGRDVTTTVKPHGKKRGRSKKPKVKKVKH